MTTKTANFPSNSQQQPVITSRKPGMVLINRATHRDIVPGVHLLPGQGNSVALETAKGVVLFDAGPGGGLTANMIATLQTITPKPVSHIVYSHGHLGYNYGVGDWCRSMAERGFARPVLVAHRRVRARYARYQETEGLQQLLNSLQFRTNVPKPKPEWLVMPDIGFEDRLVIDGGDRTIELLAAPSETDDVVAAWLPSERFLYGSAAVVRSLPNVGTPLRTLRDPMRWASTLDRLHALRPKVLLAEFGGPLFDPQDVEDALVLPAAGLRWLRQESVRLMNEGLGVEDIVARIRPPTALFDHPFMRPVYGCVDYIVRDIWRSENGWWDRNPTTLHPAPRLQVEADLQSLLGSAADVQHVVARAQALAEGGQIQQALHVIDLVAQLPEDTPMHSQIRDFKADLLDRRALQVSSVVSRNLYRSMAEQLRGLPHGSTRDNDPTHGMTMA